MFKLFRKKLPAKSPSWDTFIKGLNDQIAALKDELDVVETEFEFMYEANQELAQKNAELRDRVIEIDSDSNRDLKDEIFVLKNDLAILTAKHQIVQNSYKMCSRERDELKHSLNATNKEIAALKTKHPMYPLHWAGLDVSWEGVASDLALRLTKIEEELKQNKHKSIRL